MTNMGKFLEEEENSALLRQKWALIVDQLKYNYVISNAFILYLITRVIFKA